MIITCLLPPRLRPKVGSEDILQEVLDQAWEGLGTLRDVSIQGFHRWVAAIARRRVLDEIRRYSTKKRDVGREERCHDSPDSSVYRYDRAASKSAIRREQAAIVADALDLLEPFEREVIVLLFLEGCSPAQVAEMMNKTSGAVYLKRHRGLAKLRDLLKARGISSTIFRAR